MSLSHALTRTASRASALLSSRGGATTAPPTRFAAGFLAATSITARNRWPALSPLTMAPSKRQSSSAPEGYVEDNSKGAMLRFEDSLPQLPVPGLEETAKRYLKSVHPLLTNEEYKSTEKAVSEFIKSGGMGEKLQQRLQERANDPNIKNWLYEWWNNVAYLGDRGPVVPFVSYFYSHRDDRQRRNPAKRAAAITYAVLEFKNQVDLGTLEPEYMRKLPMAMSSYWYMFNACRIPAKDADYPVKHSYKEHPYLIVIRKNQFFKVMHEVDGKRLNAAELEKQFQKIYDTAEPSPAVGILTAERRSEWWQMRDRLLEASPSNKSVLETIQAASFAVCLDDARPVTLEERSNQYWHGDGCNRWFDKPLQFIVNDNATSGFMGEHSMMDGTPTHRLNDYVCDMTMNNKLDFTSTSVRSTIPDPVPLTFTVSEQVQRDIAQALSFHRTTLAEHELRVCAYQGYGKDLIKKFKCSPDGYVQMMIQLAYKKMYGKNRPTYESAATRKFQQGRTETNRSVTDASVAFCTAMVDEQRPAEECAKLFQEALKAHSEYIAAAADGHGVDRHLYGLSKLVKEGEQTPAIFTDPAYAYSSTWVVSSSQLSSEYFNGYGWSEVVDDGWGMAYMINNNSIQVNIVCKKLGAERMEFYLCEAADEIRDMMTAVSESPKAKL